MLCTVFTHSLFCIRNLTRSLRSLVRFLIRHNSCVNTVRTHFPWSILYLLLYLLYVLLGTKPLVDFICHFIRDPSGVFSVCHLCECHIIRSITAGLSLKLYLNSLVYHRNIFGSSSEVFGNLRTSSEIFGNFRKMSRNVRLAYGTILENLRKSSESGRKSSEIFKKLRWLWSPFAECF